MLVEDPLRLHSIVPPSRPTTPDDRILTVLERAQRIEEKYNVVAQQRDALAFNLREVMRICTPAQTQHRAYGDALDRLIEYGLPC